MSLKVPHIGCVKSDGLCVIAVEVFLSLLLLLSLSVFVICQQSVSSLREEFENLAFVSVL